MKGLARFIATGAYTGYAPLIPGTVGTLPAVALAPVLAALTMGATAAHMFVLAVIIAVAIWAAHRTEAELGTKDPGAIVIDEISGYLVAVALLPATAGVLATGFVLFRLLDIVKPPPARRAESLGGGLGVVADDLVAGLYTNLLLRLMGSLGVPWLAGTAVAW